MPPGRQGAAGRKTGEQVGMGPPPKRVLRSTSLASSQDQRAAGQAAETRPAVCVGTVVIPIKLVFRCCSPELARQKKPNSPGSQSR
jgi:hypothetical protein